MPRHLSETQGEVFVRLCHYLSLNKALTVEIVQSSSSKHKHFIMN